MQCIGARAFADIASARLIRIPASVGTIAEDAFTGSAVTIECPASSYADAWARARGFEVVNP